MNILAVGIYLLVPGLEKEKRFVRGYEPLHSDALPEMPF
jgi:hypothetical protein